MTALLQKALRRRALLQALVAVPAFSLFRTLPSLEAPELSHPAGEDGFVQRGGWILKRSEVA